jgi:hypothetical protein
MADEVYTPDQSWGDPEPYQAPDEPDRFTPDADWGEPEEVSSSALGALTRGFLREAAPSTAGGVAGMATAAALTPEVTPVGGLIGGAAVGMGASYATRSFQDWLLDQLGMRKGSGIASEAQEVADQTQHPMASAAGELSTALIPFGFGNKVQAMQRLIGGGVNAGIEAGSEVAQGRDLDPVNISLAGGVGALVNQPRGFTTKVAGRLPIGAKGRAQLDEWTNPKEPPAAGEAPTPADPTEPQGPAPAGPDPAAENLLKQYENDPLWQDYYKSQEIAPDKGNPAVAAEASQGPGPAFEPKHADAANDVTTVARGVAHENPKPPINAATGNPTGAPMDARVSAKPSEPARDYRKTKGAPADAIPLDTGEGETVTTGLTAPDVLAVMQRDKAQTTMDSSTVLPPNTGEPQRPRMLPNLQDQHEAEVARAGTEAQQRATQAPRQGQLGEAFAGEPPAGPLPADRPAAPQQFPTATMKAIYAGRKRTVVPQKPAPEPIEQIGRGPVEQPKKGLDEFSAQDLAAVLKENPAKFKEFLEADPKAVREVFARDKGLMDQVIADHPGLSEVLKPMKKSIRERERYEQGNKRLGTRGEKYKNVSEQVKSAVDEALPHWIAQDAEGEFKPDSVRALAERVMATLTQGRDGFNPFKGETGYRPKSLSAEDTLHYGPALAAKDVLDAPTEQNINTFDSWMRAYQDRNLEAAKALQDERKGAAAAALDERTKTTPLTDEMEQRLAMEPDEGAREPFPMLEKGKKVLAQNELRKYVNDLSDEDYAKLKLYDDELEHTVMGTQNPEAVVAAYKNYLAPVRETLKGGRILPDLTQAGERPAPHVAGFDAVSPEDRPGIPKKIETADDLPEGHIRLDTGPVTPEDETLGKTFMRMMGDESGAVKMPAFLTNIGNTWFAPKNPVAKQAAQEFRKVFNVQDGTIETRQNAVRQHFLRHADDMDLGEARVLMDKFEVKKPFTPDEQKTWDAAIDPLIKLSEREANERASWDPDFQAPYKDPFGNYVPHVPADTMTIQKRSNEPWRRGLNDHTVSAEDRKWFAMTDPTNPSDRRIIERDDAGDWHVLGPQGGRTQLTVPAGFPDSPLGRQIDFGGKKYTVGYHGVDELGKVLQRPPEFLRHPMVAFAQNIHNLAVANLKHRVFEHIKNNATFQANSTTDKAVADANGWVPTKLEAFQEQGNRKLYMAKQIAHVLDDYARPGVEGLEPLANLSGSMANALYFVSPAFHPLNVLDLGIHGLGGLWARAGIKGAPAMAKDLAAAWKSVSNQDAIQNEIRNNGGRTMYFHTLINDGYIQSLGKMLGFKLAKPDSIPEKLFSPLSKATNDKVDIPGTFRDLMNQSNRITWRMNDVFQTALYLQAKRTGMAPKEAVEFANRYIGGYRPEETTFLGSRTAQKLLNTPALSWFGSYHQDLFRTYSLLSKGMKDPAGRREAAGAAAAAVLMMGLVYPSIMDPFVQKLTGNEHAEFGRRGFSALHDAGYRAFVKGDKDPSRLAQNLFTPSILANMGWEGVHNKDFTGKPIWEPGASAGQNAAKTADWALKGMIPPYSTAAPAMRPGANPLTEIPKRLLESSVGIKDPSPQAVKYEGQSAKRGAQAARRGQRRPGGLFEYLWSQTK